MMNIDYSKLNDRIVEQAWQNMSPAQVQELVAGKIERARIMLESREPKTVYHQIED